MKKLNFFIALFPAYQMAYSQTQLDDYINIGLKENLVLKEKNISVEKSILALKDAKSYFLPSVNFSGNYTTAEGGRIITFPAGELMNPVYSTLNQLTAANKFSQIKNVDAQLLPNNFYDTRFHITYPLLDMNLYYNKAIRKQEIVLQDYEVEIYKQELVKDIKQAYYRYCSSVDAIAIYRTAALLVYQNLKVNQSLLSNGKGLQANVIRAESELENINSKIIEAQGKSLSAKYYFNFLLNRQLTDTVIYETQTLPVALIESLSAPPVTSGRSELSQINAGIELSNIVLRMNKSYTIPKVSTSLDLGSQASDFKFNSQSRYYLFALQLEVPLFNGHRNQYKITGSKLDIKNLQLQKDVLSDQLQLSAQIVQSDVKTALALFASSQKQLISAQAYFNLIDKGFKEGMNSLIEFIDARDQLTTSELKTNLNKNEVLNSLAAYQRQTANTTIK
jgi:outer membrane protein